MPPAGSNSNTLFCLLGVTLIIVDINHEGLVNPNIRFLNTELQNWHGNTRLLIPNLFQLAHINTCYSHINECALEVYHVHFSGKEMKEFLLS